MYHQVGNKLAKVLRSKCKFLLAKKLNKFYKNNHLELVFLVC